MLFISNAYAQEAGAVAEPSLIANILPLVIIFVIFYFLLIRPQHKKIQAHEELVKGLSRGNEVVTSGGILGKITKVEDDSGVVHVEIAPDVTVRVKRNTVTDVIEKKAKETSSKTPKKKSKAKK